MRLQRVSLIVLLLCLGTSLFCLVYPVYVIRPFRHQGVGELRLALAVTLARPALLSICTGLGLLAAWLSVGTGAPRWRKVVAIVGAILICCSLGLSRVNIYELMFHPDPLPAFAPAADVPLDADEQVLTIRLNGRSRAYPIRNIAYHHIINDVVAGRTITATY